MRGKKRYLLTMLLTLVMLVTTSMPVMAKEQLSPPENVEVEDGEISWSWVDEAESYTVYMYRPGKEKTIGTRKTSDNWISLENFNLTNGRDYEVRVRASSKDYYASDYSEEVSFTYHRGHYWDDDYYDSWEDWDNEWCNDYYKGFRNCWIQHQGDWYYLNGRGKPVRNQWIGNYYVGSNGVMYCNKYDWVDNQYYYFNSTGYATIINNNPSCPVPNPNYGPGTAALGSYENPIPCQSRLLVRNTQGSPIGWAFYTPDNKFAYNLAGNYCWVTCEGYLGYTRENGIAVQGESIQIGNYWCTFDMDCRLTSRVPIG